jgi:hypothetical protein
MCDEQRLVPIPEFLRPTIDFDAEHPEFGIDAEGRECISMDACIVPALEAIWALGILTVGCCCGHGSGRGVISIRTEEYVTVLSPEEAAKYCEHNWERWECPTCNEEETLKQECALPPAEEARTIEAGARSGREKAGKAPVCAKCQRAIKSIVWRRSVGGRLRDFHYGCVPRTS